MNFRSLLIVVLLVVIVGLGFWYGGSEKNIDDNTPIGLANPASVNCVEQGGRSEIRTAADGSQTGACIFPDGSECEEWALFRKECVGGSK